MLPLLLVGYLISEHVGVIRHNLDCFMSIWGLLDHIIDHYYTSPPSCESATSLGPTPTSTGCGSGPVTTTLFPSGTCMEHSWSMIILMIWSLLHETVKVTVCLGRGEVLLSLNTQLKAFDLVSQLDLIFVQSIYQTPHGGHLVRKDDSLSLQLRIKKREYPCRR